MRPVAREPVWRLVVTCAGAVYNLGFGIIGLGCAGLSLLCFALGLIGGLRCLIQGDYRLTTIRVQDVLALAFCLVLFVLDLAAVDYFLRYTRYFDKVLRKTALKAERRLRGD